MSMIVREGGRLNIGRYGESQVVPLHNDVGDVFDQTLIGRHDTRRKFNDWQREALGLIGSLPVVGDKLVCLRNNHAKGLLNGSLWTVEAVLKAEASEILLRIKPDEGGRAIEVAVHPACFCSGELPQGNSKHDE